MWDTFSDLAWAESKTATTTATSPVIPTTSDVISTTSDIIVTTTDMLMDIGCDNGWAVIDTVTFYKSVWFDMLTRTVPIELISDCGIGVLCGFPALDMARMILMGFLEDIGYSVWLSGFLQELLLNIF